MWRRKISLHNGFSSLGNKGTKRIGERVPSILSLSQIDVKLGRTKS
jgi:hypothetical protein